jgi:hypothetical protein
VRRVLESAKRAMGLGDQWRLGCNAPLFNIRFSPRYSYSERCIIPNSVDITLFVRPLFVHDSLVDGPGFPTVSNMAQPTRRWSRCGMDSYEVKAGTTVTSI